MQNPAYAHTEMTFSFEMEKHPDIVYNKDDSKKHSAK